MIWAISLTQTLQPETSPHNQTSCGLSSAYAATEQPRGPWTTPVPQNAARGVCVSVNTSSQLMQNADGLQMREDVKGNRQRMKLRRGRKQAKKKSTTPAGEEGENMFLWKLLKQKD